MDQKPALFFGVLMVLAAALFVWYQVQTDPFKNFTSPAAIEQSSNPHQNNPAFHLYAQNCARCHGEIGQGLDSNPPLLSINKNVAQIKAIIKQGKGKMPAFDHLSAQEIQLLAEFVKTFQ